MKILDRYIKKKVQEYLVDKVVTLHELDADSHYVMVLPEMPEDDLEQVRNALQSFQEKKNLLVVIADGVSLIKLT